MANANTEDLSNHNSKKPVIRTMENDLRSLKSGAFPKDILKNLPKVPGNLPVDFLEPPSAPIPAGAKKVQPIAKEEPIKSSLNEVKVIDIKAEKPAVPSAAPVKTEKKTVAFSWETDINSSIQKSLSMPAAKPAFKSRPYIKPAEMEILPPEARLAVQSSVTDFGAKKKAADNGLPQNASFPPSGFYKFSDRGKSGKNFRLGKILKYVLAVVAIAIVFYGIYYFLNPKSNTNLPVATESPVPESLIPGIKQNIFTVFQTGSDFDFNSSIKEYFRNIDNDTTRGVSMLVIKMKSNNKSKVLSLEDLESLLKISFPLLVLNSLDKDYNLIVFNYSQKSYLRLGLAFKINDSGALTEQLSAWEPSIFKDTEPLFLGNFVSNSPAAEFGSNNYKGASVRYLPLASADAALNYAMDKNKKFLFVATSKDDIFYLIDSVSQ